MSSALAIDPIRRPALTLPALAPLPAPSDAAPTRMPRAAPTIRVRRGRVAAASALVGGIGCVLAAQLLLSIQTADDAFRLQHLQTTSTGLAREVQVRTERLEVLAAPQHLAARAAELGMVQAGAPSALRLADGRVLKASGTAPLPSGTATVAVPDALLGR